MLEQKYFTFAIKGVSDTVFIVDDGNIFAIYFSGTDDKYQKTEINEFFAKRIGRLNLEKILHGSYLIYKKDLIDEDNYFKKKYFINIIDQNW